MANAHPTVHEAAGHRAPGQRRGRRGHRAGWCVRPLIWSDVQVLLTARSLLVALVLACAGVVLAQMPAHACTCATSTVKQQVNRADLVFSGVVVDTTRGTSRQAGPQRPTTFDIEADDRLQGRPDPARRRGQLPRRRRHLRARQPAQPTGPTCSSSPRTARTSPPTPAAAPPGPATSSPARSRTCSATGTDLTPREEPEPVVVEFTEVAGSEPETLTRLAAPGRRPRAARPARPRRRTPRDPARLTPPG